MIVCDTVIDIVYILLFASSVTMRNQRSYNIGNPKNKGAATDEGNTFSRENMMFRDFYYHYIKLLQSSLVAVN
jgi:hypothetical protein